MDGVPLRPEGWGYKVICILLADAANPQAPHVPEFSADPWDRNLRFENQCRWRLVVVFHVAGDVVASVEIIVGFVVDEEPLKNNTFLVFCATTNNNKPKTMVAMRSKSTW